MLWMLGKQQKQMCALGKGAHQIQGEVPVAGLLLLPADEAG